MSSYSKKLSFIKSRAFPRILIGGLAGIVLVYGVILLIMNPPPDFDTLPEQSAWVGVAGKYHHSTRGRARGPYGIDFKFSDGMIRKFRVTRETYESLEKNETGILFYKEGQVYQAGTANMLFIKFEKN